MPREPKPPALCACGCGEWLPLYRRSDTTTIKGHWLKANRARLNAKRNASRATPEGRAKARIEARQWRKANPERRREIQRKANQKRRLEQILYSREYRRRKKAERIAQPRLSLAGDILEAGLRIVKPGERLTGWREDEAQDRALAALEAAAQDRTR